MPNTDNPLVFISYARSDGEAYARELFNELETRQIPTWLDRFGMTGGEDWWRQITDALERVQFLILIATPAAMQSPVVAQEWRYARARGVCVFPVIIPSLGLIFNTLPRWMQKRHFYDWDKSRETLFEDLSQVCDAARVPLTMPELPPSFVQRPQEFETLKHYFISTRTLDNGSTVKDPFANTVVLRGAGGFGKSTLAACLCHDDDIQTAFADGILWIELGKTDPNEAEELRIKSGLSELHAALTGETREFVDIEDGIRELNRLLVNKDCLIVVDDVWTSRQIQPFLRLGDSSAKLITTRQFSVAIQAKGAQQEVFYSNLYEMTPTEATLLLQYGIAEAVAHETSLRKLAKRLGEWPILLQLANGALRTRMDFGDELENAIQWIGYRLTQEGADAFDIDSPEQRNDALRVSVEISLELLNDPRRGTKRDHFINLAVFPEDVDIPLEVLADLWGINNFDTEKIALRLGDLSLVQVILRDSIIRIHDLLRAYIGTQIQQPDRLHASLINQWGDAYALPNTYAWRYYGYHLHYAGLHNVLKKLLFDFHWIQAKLDQTAASYLINDYGFLPSSDDVNLVQSAIRMSAHALSVDRTQLASQIANRLLPFEEREIIHDLLEDVEPSYSWIRSRRYALRSPGDPLVRTILAHEKAVTSLALTPDDAYVVSGSEEGSVKVWEIATGSEIHNFQTGESSVQAVFALSNRVFAGSDNGSIYVWDLDRGSLLENFQAHQGAVLGLCGNENYLISASADQTIQVRSFDTIKSFQVLQGHTGAVHTIAVNGTMLISGSEDKSVKVWDLVRGTALQTLQGHSAAVKAVAITSDGTRIVSASDDRTLRVWDATTFKFLFDFTGDNSIWRDAVWQPASGHHYLPVGGIAISPDNGYVVFPANDLQIKIWDLNANKLVRSFKGHSDHPTAVAITRDGEHILSSSYAHERTIRVWNFNTPTAEESHEGGHILPIAAIATLPKYEAVVTACDDGTLKIWDAASGGLVKTLEGHSNWVRGLAISPNQAFIVSGSDDKSIRIWDIQSGSTIQTLQAHTKFVRAVAVTPDSKMIVSASDDQTLKLWDAESGELINTLKGHTAPIRAVTATPDNRFIVSGAYDQTIRVWDRATGEFLFTLIGHEGNIRSVIGIPGQSKILSSATDRRIKIWDLEKRKIIQTLEGHQDWVRSTSVSPNGLYAASVADDRTLRLWDIHTGEQVTAFYTEGTLTSCTIISDNLNIVAADNQGGIYWFDFVNSGL